MHDHHTGSHSHGCGACLSPATTAILQRGLEQLLSATAGATFGQTASMKYPLPLSLAVFGESVEPQRARQAVLDRLSDPLSALDAATVLLELKSTAGGEADLLGPDDNKFLSECFNSKRCNGWIVTLGDGDATAIESAVNSKWQFRFFRGRDSLTSLYVLLNMLVRYGFVYGRIEPGDSHALGHFIEDFTPGLIVCQGRLSDAELTLALAAMKLGVPALVPGDFPFPLGRRAVADTVEQIVEQVVAFPNIRRLLDLPEMAPLPPFMDPANSRQEISPATLWGQTEESFYIARRGMVQSPGQVRVNGQPAGPLGVTITLDAQPLDAIDRSYIETLAAQSLSMIRGVRGQCEAGRLVVSLADDASLTAEQLGLALLAGLRRELPRLDRASVEVECDVSRLAQQAPAVREELARRQAEIAATTEEDIEQFVTCVGCSPFAPDHVCVLTPQRPPQCSRPYGMIKCGALYGLDDMSNIHHRQLHSGLNSFGLCDKGRCLDATAGEWSGVNEAAASLTGGRTRRVQLHSLGEAPHTGCGCFRLIMFRMTAGPRPGVGVMDRGYKGIAPDGRSWSDLHYELAGKQAAGVAGATPAYLRSSKFLRGEGGWPAVTWVSPKIAAAMGDDLPPGVEVGPEV